MSVLFVDMPLGRFSCHLTNIGIVNILVASGNRQLNRSRFVATFINKPIYAKRRTEVKCIYM